MIRPRLFCLLVGAAAVFVSGAVSQDATPVRVAQSADTTANSSDDEYTGVQFRMPGADGGRLNTPTPVTPTTPAEQEVDTAGSDASIPEQPKITQAEMVEFYPPFYPLPLRMEGIEGRIDLRLSIGADGRVSNVEVAGATAPQFREYAVEAAKDWVFIPAKINGNPVAVRVTFPVPFISEFGSGDLYPTSPLSRLIYLDGTYYWIGDDGKRSRANLPLTPLLRISPDYSRPEGETGPLRVELRFTVNEVGRVVNPSVAESSGTEFDQVALQAIRYWQFIPHIDNGRPVAKPVKLPFVIGEDEG